MINNNRSIENAWNMLKMLYTELNGKRFKTMEILNIDSLDSLYSTIISRWCASIAKEGLYKEYVEVENEEMTSPRGQINVQESIARQTKIRGKLVCSYDELSENIYINHVLKGTLQYMLYSDKVSKEQKIEIQKTMQMFNGVDYVDISKVQWKSIKFNNSNSRYKHLIELCNTIVYEHKLEKTLELDDNKRLYILFKKQIVKWYNDRYGGEDIVEPFDKPFIDVDIEPPIEVNVNKVQKMVAIRTDEEALIICVRLQDELVLDDSKIQRRHLENLVRYVRAYKEDNKMAASGCIIYINTDKTKLNIQPISVNVISDTMVGEITVDIHDQWRFIDNKLQDVYKYFIGRAKGRKGVVQSKNRT